MSAHQSETQIALTVAVSHFGRCEGGYLDKELGVASRAEAASLEIIGAVNHDGTFRSGATLEKDAEGFVHCANRAYRVISDEAEQPKQIEFRILEQDRSEIFRHSRGRQCVFLCTIG